MKKINVNRKEVGDSSNFIISKEKSFLEEDALRLKGNEQEMHLLFFVKRCINFV